MTLDNVLDKIENLNTKIYDIEDSEEVNESKLNTLVEYLNSNTFKKNFIFSGRFKMGHRQISNSYIPEELL